MIIKDIYIDNYGIFSNTSCVGLTTGLNVVCGPNEYGKTTLLEFIRRILFGFPNRKYPGNLYSPIDGGQPGGRLICGLDDGNIITIERRGLVKGGALNITLADGQTLGNPAELTRLLQATESFYRNVYAVTIDELHSIDSLRHEEIKSRIYGADLDLGGISLTAVKKEFQDKADQIFKPRGQNQQIALIRNELRQLAVAIKQGSEILPHYEQTLEESSALQQEIVALQQQSSTRLLEIKRLKCWHQAYSDLLHYNEKEIALRGIPEAQEVGDDDVDSWQQLETAITTARSALKRFGEQHDRCQRQLKTLNPNRALLELRHEVLALERSAERFRSDLATVQQLSQQLDAIKPSIDAATGELNKLKVDESEAPELFSLAAIKHVENFKQRFEELRRFHDMYNLLAGNDNGAISSRLAVEAKMIILLVAIALIVTVTGLILDINGFLLAGGIMAGAGILFSVARYLFIRGFNGSAAVVDIKEKADSCTVLESEWQTFLAEHGMLATLTPDAFLAAAAAHQELAQLQRNRARLESEIADKQAWLDGVKNNFASVAKYVSELHFSNDMAVDIALVSTAFHAAETASSEYDKLIAELEQLDAEIAVEKSRCNELLIEQQKLLRQFGVVDGCELKRARGYARQRAELNDKLTDLKIRIKTAFGADTEIEEIRARLKDSSPNETEIKVADLEKKEEEIQSILAEKNRRLGELDNQRKNLVSSDELVSLRNRYEQKLQELRDAAGQWAKYVVAGVLIERAVRKYEQERQPEVINRASNLFAAITAQRYRGVRKPLDSDNLTAIAANGRPCDITQLSRGTREQLYLAMRFGLIEQYEARSENLPVILDDILVNFDDTRLRTAIEAIREFAVGRQVIVLTCHSRLRDILVNAGANQVVMRR